MPPCTSPVYKVVLLGSSKVGKSAIIHRLVEASFTGDTVSTMACEFFSYSCRVSNGDDVKLQIWDTVGQERFRSVSRAYFRNAVGAILVYDITSMKSFEDLTIWLTDIQTLSVPNARILLVGNKSDLEATRAVPADLAKEFADRNHLDTFIETSALSGRNVKEAFAGLALAVHTGITDGEITFMPPATPVPVLSQESKGWCC
jgi:small GTP-binding protein